MSSIVDGSYDLVEVSSGRTVEEELGLDLVTKLSRDLKSTAVDIDRQVAGYLVDVYYRMQQHRIAMGNQVSSLIAAERPDVPILQHFYGQTHQLEKQLVNVLGVWAASRAEGAWAQEQKGIGPVLSAALSAYIDIERAAVAGNVWRFAGLDISVKWIGKAARELVGSAMTAEENDVAALVWLAQATKRPVGDLVEKLGDQSVGREEALNMLADVVGDRGQVETWFEERPFKVDNAIIHVCQQTGLELKTVYQELYGPYKVDREALIKILAKRPYNASLKVVCWKIGDSFCKVSGYEDAVYGKMYLARKAQEVERNNALAFSDQAAESLATRRITDKKLKACYESGKLPPGRIELRARRYAVKMFLAHWHEVAYRDFYDTAPPVPYPIAHLGHAHKIPVPGRDWKD